MTTDEIRDLIRALDDSSIEEFSYRKDGEKLVLRKAGAARQKNGTALTAGLPNAAGQNPSEQNPANQNPAGQNPAEQKPAGQATPDAQKPADGNQKVDPAAQAETDGTAVTTPIAGIFYRAPKPGEKPFAEAGQKVKKGDTVGLIEAMKMISEIPAPCDGVIGSILVDDAQFVQYGTVLMTIGEK